MSFVNSFFIAALYAVVAVVIAIYEYRIMVRGGSDCFTVVLAFVFINLLLPCIGIYVLLGMYGADLRTGVFFFDRVFSLLDFFDSLMVYLLTILFILGLYLTAGFNRNLKSTQRIPLKVLELRGFLSVLVVTILLFVCGKFFMDLGESLQERYVNLILFRNLDPSSVRTFFSANAFSLTQTLTWLSAAMVFINLAEKKYAKGMAYFVVMLFAAFIMGSRRGLIFPLVILYFGFALWHNNLHLRKLILLMPLIVLWVGFGKELTGAISQHSDLSVAADTYATPSSLMLRALSDIGISQIESLAVLQHFESLPRFGVDHLFSVLRRFPEGMIGLEIDWPERIVRITTETFTSKDDADIPPGLIGQSWLDFPVLGALLWGMLIGIQARLLNHWGMHISESPTKIILTVLLSIIISLPLNTGSFDFTFSIDIIFLVFCMMLCFKQSRFK